MLQPVAMNNPLNALTLYTQARRTTIHYDIHGQMGPTSDDIRFCCSLRVGELQFPAAFGRSKEEAEQKAASSAVMILIYNGLNQVVPPFCNDTIGGIRLRSTIFDKMAVTALETCQNLIAKVQQSISMAQCKVISAIILKRSEDDGVVISLGTGTRCIDGQLLTTTRPGETLNVSHAEITARRGFMRFVYTNLLDYEPGSDVSLFQKKQLGREKLVLKPGISFHLYISTAPCGGGATFVNSKKVNNPESIEETTDHKPVFNSEDHGVLRTRTDKSLGYSPTKEGLVHQTTAELSCGQPLRTMTCSDKICSWNILGMQGALLSHFMEPIYMDSLTLGYNYDHGHLARAVCCRLEKKKKVKLRLHKGYKINHPRLGRVTVPVALYQKVAPCNKSLSLCMNWTLGDAAPEVTNANTGFVHSDGDEKIVSQISKLRLYSKFKEVSCKYRQQELYMGKFYYVAKKEAASYQEAKGQMKEIFEKSYNSPWVSIPFEVDLFF